MGRRYTRTQSGRFRKATLKDIGMTMCPICHRLVGIKFDEENGFIDPRSEQPDCDHTDQSGKLTIKDSEAPDGD